MERVDPDTREIGTFVTVLGQLFEVVVVDGFYCEMR